MKKLTIFTAATAAINSASGKVEINRTPGTSALLQIGCATLEFTGDIFDVPDELVAEDENKLNPNCIFGDGTIRNMCTGKILNTLNLKELQLKIKSESVAPQSAAYVIDPPPRFGEVCGKEVKFIKPVIANLQVGQRPMFLGNGKIVDQMSGKEIKKLKKGVDYDFIKKPDIEKSISDEEMASVYECNREDEERNKMYSLRR